MRPDWDQYFLAIAHLVSSRSHDEQTQVGCVIVNEDYHIVGVGYNGFPSGIDDRELPRVRPGKYAYMIHAEQNAISNMITKEKNLTAYVTAHPCRTCANLLWQNGVRLIIVDSNGVFYSMNENDLKAINVLQKNGLSLIQLKFDNTIFKNLEVKTNVD